MRIKTAKIIVFIGIIFSPLLGKAYTSLWVQHPQQTWKYGKGTIEKSMVSIVPKGIYMEYGLYLTISSRSNYSFSADDSLEAVLDFDLPKGAIVTDSWLWIGDSIMQAVIIDRWKASQIYNGIVKRRQDPSILFKMSDGQYQLRVYPLMGNGERKIKITYLVPTAWTSTNVEASIPVNIINASYYKPSLNIVTYPHAQFTNPSVGPVSGIVFKDTTWNGNVNYKIATLPSSLLNVSSLVFGLDVSLKNGIYVNMYNHAASNEGYYQLVFIPSKVSTIKLSRKVAILFDHDAGKTQTTTTEIINSAKAFLKKYFLPTDSFNLIFSQLNIFRASSKWIAADSLSIENTFAALPQTPLASYSNLPSLLANGVDFVKNNGNNGEILLLASSDQIGSSASANQLLTDIKGMMTEIFPVHIADYLTQNYSYNNIGGVWYNGNDYFYINLSKQTGGNYFRQLATTNTLYDLLNNSFKSLDPTISSFDFYSSLKNGFCFGRYTINLMTSSSIYPSQPIMQVGKYKGTAPFTLQASGVFDSVFTTYTEVPVSDIANGDSSNKTMWVGNYINDLEKTASTNQQKSDIVDISIANRVLSMYTAFLAIEPNDSLKFCKKCFDETVYLGVNKIQQGDSLMELSAAPNPVTENTVIQVNIHSQEEYESAQLVVFNIVGEKVKEFDATTLKANRKINWNGDDEYGNKLQSGIYFLTLKTSNYRKTIKLILTR